MKKETMLFVCGSPTMDLETQWALQLMAAQEEEMRNIQVERDIESRSLLYATDPDFYAEREATDPHFPSEAEQWWEVLEPERHDAVFALRD